MILFCGIAIGLLFLISAIVFLYHIYECYKQSSMSGLFYLLLFIGHLLLSVFSFESNTQENLDSLNKFYRFSIADVAIEPSCKLNLKQKTELTRELRLLQAKHKELYDTYFPNTKNTER